MKVLTRSEGISHVDTRLFVICVILGTAIFVVGCLFATVAMCAQERPRPMPQPKIGAACPTGYQSSGGACIPGPNTKCRAFPNPGSSICPSGYTKSFDYCVETGCQ
jgi:hypothetical protein